jgi:hypothetical protein
MNDGTGQVRRTGDGSRPGGPMRWLGIAARTAHLATVAVFFGGSLLQVDQARLTLWLGLALVSGAVLLALELLHDRRPAGVRGAALARPCRAYSLAGPHHGQRGQPHAAALAALVHCRRPGTAAGPGLNRI